MPLRAVGSISHTPSECRLNGTTVMQAELRPRIGTTYASVDSGRLGEGPRIWSAREGGRGMRYSLRGGACALAAFILLGLSAGTAPASTGAGPLLEAVCIRNKTVLKPAEDVQVTEAEAGVPMKRVTFCAESRRGCFVHDDEVPLSACQARR
jgi:hypothetical protein